MDVNDHGIELRNKAVGMLKAGLTLKKVSETLDISLRSVQRRSRREKLGQSLGTLPRSGRPKMKKVWSGIDPVILQNLTYDMPNRISEVINRSGDYIGK